MYSYITALSGRSWAKDRREVRSLSSALARLIVSALASALALPPATATARAIAAAGAERPRAVAALERFASLFGPIASIKGILAASPPAVAAGTVIDPATLLVPGTASQVHAIAAALGHISP